MEPQPGDPAGNQQNSRSVLPDILRTLREEIPSDHVTMVAAGLAFHAVFGLLPALAAAAALWGQISDLGVLKNSADSGNILLPDGSVQLLKQFVDSVPAGLSGGLGLLLNLGIIIYTSQRAASGLLTALNIAYDVTERRGRVRRALVALAIGVCGIALLFIALAVMALPPLFGPQLQSQVVAQLLWLRWPALILVFVLGLGVLFRFAPSRDRICWRCVAWGAAVATVLWIAASLGVSFYVAHAASFGRLYGSLGSVAIVLLWFYASALSILAGAEIDAVLAARAEGRPPSRLPTEIRRRERASQS